MQAVLLAQPTPKRLFLLFLSAFVLRAATLFFYVQYEERYKQADTLDYHGCAVSLTCGNGMYLGHQPRFWRTPGYPLYLSFFYNLFGLKSGDFTANRTAQLAALWVQIFLCSCIPIIIFFLALTLTSLLQLAWLAAWISVFHLGLILASTYLLTDGLAIIFFYLFLLFLYKSFTTFGEKKLSNRWFSSITCASLSLALFTWMRPMGNFVALVAMFLLFILAQDRWKQKIYKIALFTFIFIGCTLGWYIRNYQLTGRCFFCPMFGLYCNVFNAPKIVRRLENKPLLECWQKQQQRGAQEVYKMALRLQGTNKKIVPEIDCGNAAWPLLYAHPWYALQDWIQEVTKTTFDMYSSHQLVAFANNTFMCDPLEEFLLDKIKAALYQQPMPRIMRVISWLEFIFVIFKWIGLFSGSWLFMLYPLFKKFHVSPYIKKIGSLWLKTTPLIGAVLFMTGGFGYARLRLPVDPLLIILSLTFWYWLLKEKK